MLDVVDLEQALDQFDRTQTNLERLQDIWERMQQLIPPGIVFPGTGPDELLYDELSRAFYEIENGLPAIDGFVLSVELVTLRRIAQLRFDAEEISEPEILIPLGEELGAPMHAVAEYRHRLTRARKRLVRARVVELVAEIDGLLAELAPRYQRDGTSVADDSEWQRLHSDVKELDRLVGQDVSRKGRWDYLARHLSFAQAGDLHDIVEHDWPSVRPDVEAALYGELEPLPVDVDDLGSLAAAEPEGSVTTALNWAALDDDGFERLVFNLLSQAPGYENPRWLMKTRAPDRGRDVSVERTITDSLSGVTRRRIIVQCKHSLSRSLNVDDCLSAAGGWRSFARVGSSRTTLMIAAAMRRRTCAWWGARRPGRTHPGPAICDLSVLLRMAPCAAGLPVLFRPLPADDGLPPAPPTDSA